MAALSPSAARIRQHRLAFQLALELGCTPREAEEELRRRAAAQRNQAACARLAAKLAAQQPCISSPVRDADIEPVQPWWKRDDL